MAQLRMVFENAQSIAKERTWLKHQPHGELDDSKVSRVPRHTPSYHVTDTPPAAS